MSNNCIIISCCSNCFYNYRRVLMICTLTSWCDQELQASLTISDMDPKRIMKVWWSKTAFVCMGLHMISRPY